MDEAGLPEESHESLKVISIFKKYMHKGLVVVMHIGASLSLGSTRSSFCWHHKSRLGCS